MSVRFTGDKTALRRTVNLPAAHSAFTVCGFGKLLVAAPSRTANIVYTQSPASSETVFLQSGTGTSLRASDDYGASSSAEVASLTAGGAEGSNWFYFALVGLAAGANGLRLYHKPVGTASPTFVSLTNTPGTAQFDVLQLGDAPFGTTFWYDGLLAHLKVYNRALSESEVAAEATQGAPVSSTNLISYHSFSNSSIATAVAPDAGTGTFFYFTSAPSTSTDMPVFVSPPSLEGEDDLPESGDASLSGEDTLTEGPAILGDLTATLGAATLAATATAPRTADLTATLGAATLSSTTATAIAGSLTSTLGAATLSSTGVVPVFGDLSVTLGAATLEASDLASTRGVLNATLGAATLSATASAVLVERTGVLSATLGSASLSSAGTVGAYPLDRLFTATVVDNSLVVTVLATDLSRTVRAVELQATVLQ